ncbi:MAG: calcineurin-like phosphoesterase family protein [Pirellulaceae bacterium]
MKTIAAFPAILMLLHLPVAMGFQVAEKLNQPTGASVVQAAEEPQEVTEQQIARGRVFIDNDGDKRFSPGDSAFQGIRVSNGIEIVKTNETGEYELPISNDGAIFVIKPSGFRTDINELNLPRFFYLHKPNGSPKLRFPGVEPTGPLPQSIDFPLYRQSEPDQFRVILFGDPQPRNDKEVDYIAHDVVSEMIGYRAAFGVTLGDIVFDDLDVFSSLNQTVSLIGIPWYNVIGNHDVNYDGGERQFINETYERIYGPSYYSFDYGQVHFVVMDNIDWEQKGDGKMGYAANFGEQQREFLKRDLELCPENQMVVLMMHVPLYSTKDTQDLFRLIEKRPFCISISGHTHTHEHVYFGQEQGWQGDKPHHHIVNVTVSGSWWSGQKDERGIPHTTMADGGPNGCSVITFDGQDYTLDYLAAGVERGNQMRVEYPVMLGESEVNETPLFVNFYNGSDKSKVAYRIDGAGEWITMDKVNEIDPFFQRMYDWDQASGDPNEPRLTKPKPSTHLWKSTVTESIPPGVHLIEVKATDDFGRTFTSQRSVRVTK